MKRRVRYALGFVILVLARALSASPSPDLPSPSNNLSPSFTAEELQWIEDNNPVSFTGDPNWLPYEAFTEDGEYVGIVAEHLALISAISGIEFDIKPTETWTESTLKAKNGEVDILSETDDSDLKSHLAFTQPYITNPIVIAMDFNQNYVESIADIKDKKIALIKNYGYAAKIRRKYKGVIKFETVENIQDGLISVSTGKIDALLCTLALCSYTIHELGLNNVKITGKTEFDTKLALGVQKKHVELLSILNKSIQQITPGQQQKILDAWINNEYVEKVDYTPAYIVFLVSILILFILFRWNRRLSKEILLRKEVESKLKKTSEDNERYKVLFFGSAIGYVVTRNKTGEFLTFNQSFSDITGYTLEELNSLSFWDLTPKIYEEKEQEQLKSIQDRGSYGPYEKHYIQKTGRWIPIRLNGSLIVDPIEGELIISAVEDMSEFAETKEKLRLSSLVLENSSEAMIVTDENNKIVAVNPAFTRITGYLPEEALGKDPSVFKSDVHDSEFYSQIWDEIRVSGKWQGEVWEKRKNGELFVKWLTVDTIRDTEGNVSRYVGLFSDITERKRSEETIWQQANFDALTNLPNRNMLYRRLHEIIDNDSGSKTPLAILMIDLDEFKEVNDTLGHDKGDQLLEIASRRIVDCIKPPNIVARLGGDEFTIVLLDHKDLVNIDNLASQIISGLSEPYNLDGSVVYITASLGVTTYPDDAENIEALIKNADQAMYVAKGRGRNCYSFFTRELQTVAQKRLHLSNELRNAISNDEFKVYYQPIVDLASRRIYKAEALIRWFHPEMGLVSPAEFIPLAEDIGVISEIDDWVYQVADAQRDQWAKRFDANFKISVNVSPVQFKSEGDVGGNLLLRNTYGSSCLILEITEGLLLKADPDVLDKLQRIREAGAEVAIDDFGTGYSSLSYIKKFNIDYLKIDQSFTRNLEESASDKALCEAIIVMAHKLGLKVVAEGVETEYQQEVLQRAGCDFAQGYLYSPAVPPEEMELLIPNEV